MEQHNKTEWNGRCICGHLHNEHNPVRSHNYTAGRCTVGECRCNRFVHDARDRILTGEFYFQFGDDNAIKIANVYNHEECSVILGQLGAYDKAEIEFFSGNKKFRLFIKPIIK